MKNGIKYLIAGLVATGLTVSSSYAVITVGYGANGSTFVTDNTGANNYLNGDLVEIGTFATAPTLGSSSLAGFSVFDSTTTSTGAFTGSGTHADTGFAHDQIYLVVFNAATSVAATQEGIFYVNDASNTTWKFPASADTPNSTTIDIDQMFATPGLSTVGAAGATVVFGSTGQDLSGPYTLLETAPLVPEPSTYLLVGTGLLGLLGLRRRK